MYKICAVYLDESGAKHDTTSHETMGEFYGLEYERLGEAELDCTELCENPAYPGTFYEVLEV